MTDIRLIDRVMIRIAAETIKILSLGLLAEIGGNVRVSAQVENIFFHSDSAANGWFFLYFRACFFKELFFCFFLPIEI